MYIQCSTPEHSVTAYVDLVKMYMNENSEVILEPIDITLKSMAIFSSGRLTYLCYQHKNITLKSIQWNY